MYFFQNSLFKERISMIDLSKERVVVYGVSYQCPAGKRVEDCLLKKLDILSFKEKVERINALSKEEIELIVEHHIRCSKHRDF